MGGIDGSENVARILKSAWVFDGEISPSAFNLRPQIHETYISVLREACDSFSTDVKEVAHGKFPVRYAQINVGELRKLQVDALEDEVNFDVKAVDNFKLLSHAGIFIFINFKQLVGGEPFESVELKHGMPADSILMTIREALSEFAKKNLFEWNERPRE